MAAFITDTAGEGKHFANWKQSDATAEITVEPASSTYAM
jgi:hypothetical protein